MERPSPILLVVDDVRAPSAYDDVARFLGEVRAPALAARGASVHVFGAKDAAGGTRAPRFLTVVEAALTPTVLDEVPGHADLVRLYAASFEGVRTFDGRAPTGEVRGLLLGITDCTDAARLPEFHAWYDDHHAVDVVRRGLYFSARRFARVSGDMPEFLALYETEAEGPATFARHLADPLRDRAQCDVCAIRHVWTFDRLFSCTR